MRHSRLKVFVVLVGALSLWGCNPDNLTSHNQPVPEVDVHNGQTCEEVIALLGEPNGRIENNDNLCFFYKDEVLRFHEGILVNFDSSSTSKVAAGAEEHRRRAALKRNVLAKWWFVFLDKLDAKALLGRLDFSDKAYRQYRVPGRITVVAFYAGWLSSDKQGLAGVRELISPESGVSFCSVALRSPTDPMAQQYGIYKAPSFMVLDRNGRKVGELCDDVSTVARRIQRAGRSWFGNIKAIANGEPDPLHKSLLAPGSVTVVYFCATWCGVCTEYGPMLTELVRNYDGVVLRRVDVGDRDSSRVFEQYDLRGVPQVRVFDCKGRLVGGTVIQPGAVEQNIRRALKTRSL